MSTIFLQGEYSSCSQVEHCMLTADGSNRHYMRHGSRRDIQGTFCDTP